VEPSLFSFIWAHSKRQQLGLLAFTLVSFPFLYVSLELPKRIINDAIGAETSTFVVLGIEFSQYQYLFLLCFGFLAAVVIAGLMKMRLNTMKGVVSERMLRRLRYTLINRMMRFPSPYFRTTSQGELVSMVTSEAEPMGGLMGDAVAQPAFQAGQMLTILIFLFAQSVWFGLASIALIPLQAYLIPMLQRQINLLNKDRIKEVRHLSSEIGETAAGISDLRVNGGVRYRLAQITERLGRLFEIRYRIYQKKFFMKFLNNFISQLTPFFFYSVGGYLAIRGEITVGALVAALAAYKDLSNPWKELLTYYNQVQDMSLRWQVVTERFAPSGMIDEALFYGEPAEIPSLKGEIVLDDVTVLDANGNAVIEDLSLTIPEGARVAIQSVVPAERQALAQLLTREIVPSRGKVTIAGHDLNTLHQSVIAARIGHAHSRPYLFDGSLGDNLMMPLRSAPKGTDMSDKASLRRANEARWSGNSLDTLDVDWVDPGLAGLESREDVRAWWFQLVGAMEIDQQMFRRMMRHRIDVQSHPKLTRDIVAARADVEAKLIERGLRDLVYRFDPARFNPTIPLGGNLLFAAPVRDISPDDLAAEDRFMSMLEEENLDHDALEIAGAVMQTLMQTFGRDGTNHPLFRRVGIDEDLYQRLCDIADRRKRKGDDGLSEADRRLLVTVPFLLTAEQIGTSFSDVHKARIVEMRKAHGARLIASAQDLFAPVAPDTYLPRLTIMENALYGRVSMLAGGRADEIEDVVAEVLKAHDLERRIAAVLFDTPAGLGGASLPTIVQERIAFCRAAIKRPDVLIMDKALASHDARQRVRTRDALRKLLPGATLIFMEDHFEHPERYDLFVEIKTGRIDGITRQDADQTGPGAADLQRKLDALAGTDLFSKLDARNLRLLAFSAQWYEAEAGQVIFATDQPADAAYLCLEGKAELRWPGSAPDEPPLSLIEPGRLIGDLSIITRERRPLDLVSVTKTKFLRLGAEEFRDVIESDANVAVHLLETVAGYLNGAAELLRMAQVNVPDHLQPGIERERDGAREDLHDA
jgi:ABC-type multidrug transport system fused ATPase/permease subunit/CRP-like cAMP-binding protein